MPKPNNEDAVKIQRTMLKAVGAWPVERPTSWYSTKLYLNYFLTLCLSITMLMEGYNDLNNFTKLSEILYILITILAYNFKHASFYIQRNTFIRLIKLLNSPLFHSYPNSFNRWVLKNIRSLQLVVNWYRSLVLICAIFMCSSPLFTKQPFPFPFPYDLGTYKYLMYLFQTYTLSLVAWINLSLDALCACLMGTAAMQLDILARKIIRIQKQNFTQISYLPRQEFYNRFITENLEQCIEHHMGIVEYVECIEKVFSFGILVQFLGSIIIICNTLFQFVWVLIGSSHFFTLISYLVIMLYQLFMYCWFANDVVLKSRNIGEACYFSKWEHHGNLIGIYLFIIMERSKRPFKITAFKFSDVSLSTFTTIIQWSYSYFALLTKLYSKQHTKE